MSSVALVTGGASSIGPATDRRLEVLEIPVTSFHLQGSKGQVGDDVGQSRKDKALQKRGNGAVKHLAVFPALP